MVEPSKRPRESEEEKGLSEITKVLVEPAREENKLTTNLISLAFIALGIGLMRYFGLGPWTILDGSLTALGAVAALFGIRRFLTTIKHERRFARLLDRFMTMEIEAAAGQK